MEKETKKEGKKEKRKEERMKKERQLDVVWIPVICNGI